jgi:hypothetical protein
MSKVEELRLKYPKVTKPTFNKFVEADVTPTKKYLEFMLKTWTNRGTVMVYTTTKIIIDIVKKFDSLLPYIDNKDIYHKDYADLALLYYVIDTAEAARDEKTFVREEHANVLIENDRYLLLQPTTHRGSLKYGAGSKWCTASKRDPEVFTRYTKNGYLAYLIDKTKKVSGTGGKMALYLDYSECSINGKIDFFNTIDSNVTVSSVRAYDWDESDLFDIVTTFRYYHIKMKTIKKDRDFVDGFVISLTKLNFEEFEKSLNNLEDKGANVYTLKIKEKVEEFLSKLNKTQYAIRETKN